MRKKGKGLACESRIPKEKESTLGLNQKSNNLNINVSSSADIKITIDDVRFAALMSGRVLSKEQEAKQSRLLDNENVQAYIIKKAMDAFANIPPERKALMETIYEAHKAQEEAGGSE